MGSASSGRAPCCCCEFLSQSDSQSRRAQSRPLAFFFPALHSQLAGRLGWVHDTTEPHSKQHTSRLPRTILLRSGWPGIALRYQFFSAKNTKSTRLLYCISEYCACHSGLLGPELKSRPTKVAVNECRPCREIAQRGSRVGGLVTTPSSLIGQLSPLLGSLVHGPLARRARHTQQRLDEVVALPRIQRRPNLSCLSSMPLLLLLPHVGPSWWRYGYCPLVVSCQFCAFRIQ